MEFGSSQFVSSLSSDPLPASSKSRDEQPVVPVTVKQISGASSSDGDKSTFVIDGADVSNVKLLGIAYEKSVRATDATFVVDDGTGRIECQKWVNDSVDTEEVENLTDGTYVRIYGHLKSFQGKKRVVVFAVRPVTDFNEVAYHYIECMHTHCCRRKAEPAASAPSMPPSSGNTTSPVYQTAPPHQKQEYNGDGLGSIDKMVVDYLAHPSRFEILNGVHRNEIAQALKISQEKLAEAIAHLEDEGAVFSTIDDDHYKSAFSTRAS